VHCGSHIVAAGDFQEDAFPAAPASGLPAPEDSTMEEEEDIDDGPLRYVPDSLHMRLTLPCIRKWEAEWGQRLSRVESEALDLRQARKVEAEKQLSKFYEDKERLRQKK
jgi:hypothetical protein